MGSALDASNFRHLNEQLRDVGKLRTTLENVPCIPLEGFRAANAASKAKTFFAGAQPMDDSSPAPPPKPEGRWMSTPTAKAGAMTPIVPQLDGKYVSIAWRVRSFLLPERMQGSLHCAALPASAHTP
jgi:hypothetical protein